ncbi:MAG: hypothetical protein SFU25_08805 [Candidatus Caenarcaniphilales bacterium]|nr:hypothetical protein [Candidatus Caenarcaniphilales bacterium]
MSSETILQNYILYFILPFWVLVGTVDYLCHRISKIETTSGIKESFIHLLMVLAMALPVGMGLILKINSLVIVIMIFSFLLHEVLLFLDVSCAYQIRLISPIEQHIHGFLHVIPFMLVSIVICLNWQDFLSIFKLNGYSLQWKETPFPKSYLFFITLVAAFLVAFPYLEEFWRSYIALKAKSIQK